MTATTVAKPDLGNLIVADGDVLVRLAVAQYLRDCGYRVIEAASSDELVIVLDRSEILVDLALCDVAVPGEFNGFTLSHWMHEHHPDIDLILVGSDAAAAHAAAALCDRGPVLARPYEPKDVLLRIQTMFAERSRRQKSGDAACVTPHLVPHSPA
jgi:DNA-binding NtrC family response regulator